MQKTLLFITLIAFAAAQILNSGQLLLRYSMDTNPPRDEGALTKGMPNVYGNPTSTTGKLGNGVRFNANGAATDLFAVGQFGLNAPLTVTAWFSVDSFVLGQSKERYNMKILSNKWTYDDTQGIEIQFTPIDNKWRIITPCVSSGYCPDIDNVVYTSPAYNADEFHHIAVVVSTTTVTLYLDGASVLTASYTKPLTSLVTPMTANRQTSITGQNGHQIAIGGSLNGATFNAGGEWHGVLDEVRIYNYTLSASDVSAVYGQANLDVANNANVGTAAFSSFTCPTTATSRTGSLVAYNDMLPKDSNGNQNAEYPVNFVTLHRLRDTIDPPHDYANPAYPVMNNNFTTVTIKNLGSSSITINQITSTNSTAFPLNNVPSLPATLAAGATLTFGVSFEGSQGINIKTAQRSTITVASTDSAMPTLTITAVGLYQDTPEGSNEVSLQTILNAFGYSINTNIGYEQQINWDYSPLQQDEVAGQYWMAANPNSPVTVKQIAAFGGLQANPTDNTVHQFGIYYDKTGDIDCGQQVVQVYIQTIIPKCFFASTNTIGDCLTSCKPGNKRFYFGMDKTRFSVTSLTAGDDDGQGPKFLNNQVSWKFFPVRLADGTMVPNAFVATQDYSLPKGCGDSSITPGVANCDYQDNIWIVTNIQPADDSSSFTTTYTLPVSFSFNQAIDGFVADKSGNGGQFYSKFQNSLDSHIKFDSYQSNKIALDTTTGALTLTTSAGSPQAKTLVNGLKINLNPQSTSFYVQVTIDPSTVAANAYAGVMIGSDLYNYAMVYYNNGAVSFYVETQSGQQAFGDVFPTFTTTTKGPITSSLPSTTGSITLILAVDPVARTVTPSVASAALGQSTEIAPAYTLPGVASGFGIGPAGRLTGYGTGAGIVAWNDAGATSNVKFYNFAASNCGATITPPADTNGGNTPTPTPTSNNSGNGNNGGNGTPTSNNNGNNGNTGNPGNGVTLNGSASSVAAGLLVVLIALLF